MRRRTTLLVVALTAAFALQGLGPQPGYAEPEGDGAEPAQTIAWLYDVPAAFAQAAAEKKVLMICINAKNAMGEHEEPAAKGLREVVYLDPAVVEKSREFVCAFLTAEGSSEDYGELRYRLGVDGFIVSPQHIFTHPQHEIGMRPLVREEYWPYGDGERAVKALLALMEEALSAYHAREDLSTSRLDPADEIAPKSAADRAAWIEKLIALVRDEDTRMRRQALRALAEQDQQGDCIAPLVALLEPLQAEERDDALVDVVRRLGVPGLEAATPVLHALLTHEDRAVRGNAAVTLEYIGSPASTQPLLDCLKREKDVALVNHVARALGRCGVGDDAARRKLLRQALPGKEEDFGSFGAVLGLAYLEGDAKAARAVERQILKLGDPFRQGQGVHTFLRAALIWCLGEIRDPKTAPFLRKRVMAPLEKEASPWKGSLLRYCDAVARKCEGDDEAQQDVDKGVEGYLWADNASGLADRFRRGREMGKFVPKGEWGNRPATEAE